MVEIEYQQSNSQNARVLTILMNTVYLRFTLLHRWVEDGCTGIVR